MKNDRRVAYTKMVLKQSFLELIQSKPISKITVKEICEKADINRATFYIHFTDVYDLLNQIENELYDTIQRSLDKGWQTINLTELLTEICIDIKQNGELCKAILSENGDKDFINRIINIAYEQCITDWKLMAPKADLGKLEKLYTFFSHGSAAVVLSWVQTGMKESPKSIALFIEQITRLGQGSLSSEE